MPTSQTPDESPSRIEREIDEILEQASKRPVSFQDHVARRRTAMQMRKQTATRRWASAGRGIAGTAAQWALRIPLLTALVLALLAFWLSPDYQLLASILAIAAAVMIFVPFVRRTPPEDDLHRPRWRGRVVSNSPPARLDRGSRSWLDQARDRLGR